MFSLVNHTSIFLIVALSKLKLSIIAFQMHFYSYNEFFSLAIDTLVYEHSSLLCGQSNILLIKMVAEIFHNK